MEFFARFRRPDRDDPEDGVPPRPAPVLPQVNQRVTVWIQGHSPAPSRVEDDPHGELVLSSPSLALEPGDPVTVSWEGEAGWYSLDTTVTQVDDMSVSLPMIAVASHGRLARHDERRGDLRMEVSLPLELRVVAARVVKGGRSLRTGCVELSPQAVRFSTSAPFSPGDVLEGKLELSDTEFVSARLRVIRMDTVSGSWRQTCTATFDEILRSDRSRIVAFLEGSQRSGGPIRLEELRPGS